MANIDVVVGRRIRQRRDELKWSADQLAERLSISPGELYDYEQGLLRPEGRILVKIALVLERPPSYFFEGADD